ncbi:hypothetical protein H261_05474 [Paramagnetospirillum caucaseum]|uniref:DUF3489 domain-containing protein n=1 Tax=Paramagnetospirillum caucaseum TaxID=1244869 RepID=M2Z9E8_9PROT|nr:DUF3489 domain-containing protein [Paramagnetospirillum caucaseum]EME71010.1 hypothetical protein H261_05474 [Paramagnetospirillum caucaseum]
MIQLSDTQAVILSAACAREDGNLLPVTASLKGGAVNMVLNSLIKKELAEEIPAEPGAPVWREDEDGTPLTLRATAAAYAALGIESATAPTGADTAPEEEPAMDVAEQPETPPMGAHGAHEAKPARKTREGTKQEALIALLKRPEGASIEEISTEFGWAHHTVRGAIAGALKKKLGLAVTSEKVEGRGRTYKIAE